MLVTTPWMNKVIPVICKIPWTFARYVAPKIFQAAKIWTSNPWRTGRGQEGKNPKPEKTMNAKCEAYIKHH